ncbi:uncharacterized protein TNCV_2526281 [Trichonephila clavipes]|nr:uncharacterized protein TNCV_2526281 [Trichonephila clavipes]
MKCYKSHHLQFIKLFKEYAANPNRSKNYDSGDLLIETSSALQTKSLLLTKTFLDCSLIVNLHRSLNSCRGVISETDLLCASEAEILDGLSDQGVSENQNALTVHRFIPPIPNCPKSKTEKEIQTIKTNRNISYFEARKLIAPQFSQTYAQVAKPSIATSKPLALRIFNKTNHKNCISLPKPISSAAAPDNNLNTSASSLSAETRTPIRFNKSAALSTEIQTLPESDSTASNGEHFNAPEVPQCAKRNSRSRRKRPKVQKAEFQIQMAPHRPRKSTPTELTTDEEDMIMYDVQAEELEQILRINLP